MQGRATFSAWGMTQLTHPKSPDESFKFSASYFCYPGVELIRWIPSHASGLPKGPGRKEENAGKIFFLCEARKTGLPSWAQATPPNTRHAARWPGGPRGASLPSGTAGVCTFASNHWKTKMTNAIPSYSVRSHGYVQADRMWCLQSDHQ